MNTSHVLITCGLALLASSVQAGLPALAGSPVPRNPYVAPARQIVIPPLEQGSLMQAPPAAFEAEARTGKPLDMLFGQLSLVGVSGPVALVRQRLDSGRLITHQLREGEPWIVDGREFKVSVSRSGALEVRLTIGTRLEGIVRTDAPQPQAQQAGSTSAGAPATGANAVAPAPAPLPKLMGSPNTGSAR